ncbi:MAG: helix-turn-helix transcriptional regulator [Halolamina sp.]
MDRFGALLVVLVAALILTGGTTAAAGEGFGSLQSGDVETDAVVLSAAVDADGDATWTIDYRIRLDDENTTAAFDSLRADIRNNTSDYRGQFANRMRSTVAAAENATGREMAVSNVSVTTRTTIDGQYGVVSYSFQWTGFAATENGRIVIGDALAGLFLDADTKLTFNWPDGYELASVDPAPDGKSDQSVTWEGPTDFGTNQPRVVVAEPGLLPGWAPIAAGVVLVLVGAAWYYRRKQAAAGGPPSGVPATGESTAETGATAEPGTSGEGGGEAGEASEPAAETGAEESGAAASETPEELLSPEERVLNLLEDHGGRMKQQVVTEELDWSAARTSQVVSDLRDEGKVESFRLGRENVLRFPEESDELGRTE